MKTIPAFRITRACTTGVTLLYMILLAALTTGCQKKQQEVSCNCDQLREGLHTGDRDKVAPEIGSLSADLAPAPTTTDQFGQHDNLYVLANRMSRQCGFQATVLHYNGIKTYPPQSEIRVADGSSFNIVLDIGYNDQYKLVFRDMHE